MAGPPVSLAARVVLMHQGGWDEIAIVGGPLLIIGVLIAVARKQRPLDQDPDDPDDPDDSDESGNRGGPGDGR